MEDVAFACGPERFDSIIQPINMIGDGLAAVGNCFEQTTGELVGDPVPCSPF